MKTYKTIGQRLFTVMILSLVVLVASLAFTRPVQAFGCQYNIDGKPVCDPIQQDGQDLLDETAASSTCRTICRGIGPSCTGGELVPLCVDDVSVSPIISLQPPIVFAEDIPGAVGNIVNAIVGVIGALTFLVFFYGGFLWLTSAGNEEKVTQGTQAMIWAVVGLFVIFSSYAVLNQLIKAVTG